jgi:uncharacterized repeat protein (TIGR03803 family)
VVLGALVFQLPAGVGAQTREHVVYSFCSQTNCSDGANPSAGLIDVNGTLFGTTYGGYGAVFSFDPETGTETVLYSFCRKTHCADGQSPIAALIDVHGKLYGTTQQGGVAGGCYGYGCGTVFSLDPGTGREKVLYSFCGQANCTDGALPWGSLIDVNGTLYGTTSAGGTNGKGTVFCVDPKTGAETVVHSFAGSNDGANPYASLIDVNGTLYGTTSAGGVSGSGTVFSVDPNIAAEAVLYSFCSQKNCADGLDPSASLIDVNGSLYGTTLEGGTGGCNVGCGTVFSIDPSTGAETVAYSFLGGSDGETPEAPLIEVQGVLYGTTDYGASFNSGTVFSFDLGSGAETVLYSFCSRSRKCRDGAFARGSLLKVQGRLYGTTYFGGADGYGEVFRLRIPCGGPHHGPNLPHRTGFEPGGCRALAKLNARRGRASPSARPASAGRRRPRE